MIMTHSYKTIKVLHAAYGICPYHSPQAASAACAWGADEHHANNRTTQQVACWTHFTLSNTSSRAFPQTWHVVSTHRGWTPLLPATPSTASWPKPTVTTPKRPSSPRSSASSARSGMLSAGHRSKSAATWQHVGGNAQDQTSGNARNA